MNDVLPPSVREALRSAERAALLRKSRLTVVSGTARHRVLRMWSRGFAVAAEDVPPLRGLVDLYEGSHHLCQALIVTDRDEDGERVYEFKRSTAAADSAPLDFERPDDAPTGLLPRY